ncbi:MAG: VCBS repeat-containing protein, partial [Candidatus Bathyarchaeia archaeon]
MNKTLRKGFTTLLIAMVLLIAFLPNIAQAENGLTLEKSHAWSTDGESYTNAVAARDIDNDGITEMVTVGYFHNSTTDYYDGEMNIWSWNGTELTSEHNEYFHPEYTTSNDTHFNAVALSNVDNDTDIEVIGAGYGNFLFVISLFPIPKFVFQEQGFLFVGNWNGSSLTRKAFTRWPDNENETTRFLDLAVGDVDKDNVVEIVAVGYRNMTGPAGFHGVITIWNITEGNLVLEASYEKMISGETIWRSVSINDVDDDGELEIVIVGDFYDKNLKQRCATLRICTWDGSTLDWELGYQWYTYSETYANAVTTGDIDEDGIPEIITIGYHANGEIVNAQLRVWSWKQEVLTLKASVESGRIEPPAITFGTAVAIGDVDSDGKNEIVVGVNFWIIYWSRAHIKIFSWNGETLATEESKDWEEASYIQSIVIDDVDNDAKAEIVTAGFTAGLMIVPQSNLGIWSISKVSSSITVAVEPSSIVIGEQVTISGRVTNETGDVPIPNAEVRIEYSREPIPVFVYLATVVTDE